jgi:hypothetical protein
MSGTASLAIGPRTTTLARDGHAHTLPFGVETIAAVLRHAPPAAREIEQAIDVIEEALMRVPAELRGPGSLTIDAASWRGWCEDAALDRSAVEDRFQRLASAALGDPAALQALPRDSASAATLVIVREAMHHLGYERPEPHSDA